LSQSGVLVDKNGCEIVGINEKSNNEIIIYFDHFLNELKIQ